MTDEQRATISLRYGKVQVTIGLGLLVGVFWLVSEAVSIRATVIALAAKQPAVDETLLRIEERQGAQSTRLARIEDRLDRRNPSRTEPQ